MGLARRARSSASACSSATWALVGRALGVVMAVCSLVVVCSVKLLIGMVRVGPAGLPSASNGVMRASVTRARIDTYRTQAFTRVGVWNGLSAGPFTWGRT